MFPLDLNAIMLRIENIGDLFNSKGQVQYQTINMLQLASGLFESVNGYQINDNLITIEETSLTGNQPYDQMVLNKISWRTTEDKVQSDNLTGSNGSITL